MRLSSTITVSVKATLDTDLAIVRPAAATSYVDAAGYTNGTGAAQADRIYQARRSVADSSTPEVLPLSSGLVDALGNALSFASITTILVKNRSATAGEVLTVGGGTHPLAAWLSSAGAGVKVGPGGRFLIDNPSAAAYAVAAGSADKLTISADAGGDVPFDVIIQGRSA